MSAVLLPVAAICTAVVFLSASLLLSALGHDKAAIVTGVLGVLLPILIIVSLF